MKTIESFPLCWPDGWRRTPPSQRTAGKFNRKERVYSSIPGGSDWHQTKALTVSLACERVIESLQRMGLSVRDGDLIISTNIRPTLAGIPRSGERQSDDPGCAVYWIEGKEQRCMAVDRYTSVAANLAAIAATLEAMRAIERHGGAEILNRAFQGFAALPAKASQSWREVFGFGGSDAVTEDAMESAFRSLAKKTHPDLGGNEEDFKRIVQARQDARRDLNLPFIA